MRTVAAVTSLVLAMSVNGAVLTPTNRVGTSVPRIQTSMRSQNMLVAADELRSSKTFAASLFGEAVQITRDRLVPTVRGATWYGHITGEERSSAVFATVGNAVAGTIIRADGTMYQLRAVGNDVHVLEQIDNSQYPNELPPGAPPADLFAEMEMDAEPTCKTDSAAEIDALVLYTKPAQEAAGGTDAMLALIDLAVAETNTSYGNSSVTQRVRLVHAAEVEYTESGSLRTDRDRLRGKGDGFLESAHSLRDKFGADVVVLIVESGVGCGIAYIMEKVSNAFEAFAFGVVRRNCATGNYSFGHELGHIMGARHDWHVDSTDNSPFHNNHGFVKPKPTAPAKPWRTIMSYNDACETEGVDCTRIWFWANPAITFAPGDPMGVGEPKPTDDHDTLNRTARTVANFRCRVSS